MVFQAGIAEKVEKQDQEFQSLRWRGGPILNRPRFAA